MKAKLLAALALLAACGQALADDEAPAAKPVPLAEVEAGATVEVSPDFSRGHGSGVHIGDNFILTAAHVVGAKSGAAKTAPKIPSTVSVKSGDTTLSARVLWVNSDYDLALLRAGGSGIDARAPLSCREAKVGEAVTAFGNPLTLGLLKINGSVAAKSVERGPWRSAWMGDFPAIPGMSGGPVFDTVGNLIGITVGVPEALSGPVALAIVVPATAACELLGRAS